MTTSRRAQTEIPIRHVVLAGIFFVLATSTAVESKSTATISADQYPSENVVPVNEEVLKTRHRFDIQRQLNKKTNIDKDIVPDLQVALARKERRKREANDRKSRSYFSYVVETPASLSYSTIFKPQPFKIERTYYIPVWGSSGRFPIYFPPQPLNTGYPSDNPPRRPSTKAPTKETTTLPPVPAIGNRFKDDGPVWDSRPARPEDNDIVPTRKPSTKTSTFPPLLHDSNPTSAPALDAPPQALPPQPTVPPMVQTTRRSTRPLTTTAATSIQPNNQCVWAIVNCCSAGSRVVSASCFERLGCPGPFWDNSPCESQFAKRAIQFALNYYA
ncbi:hypothetical protein MML48_6g00012934 [Holotrichia oblita]|uniref:Uncharacterized protein n=1 Tax=Holotrichia oblita TaxID=644536 RepID=A0ACB9SYU0_HOLOL|nr:hypothetical protein MML48_6g00012934 [Holotrichia oblita]